MARKTAKRPAKPAIRNQTQPRTLLLAGIGAVSLGRKKVLSSYAQAIDGVGELRQRAEGAVHDAEAAAIQLRQQAEARVQQFRKQAKAKIAPIQKKAMALAGEARSQAETRLAPVLEKLGVAKAPVKRRATRKAPAKRAAAKRGRRAA